MRNPNRSKHGRATAASLLAFLLAASTASSAEYTPRSTLITEDPEGYTMGWSHAFTVRHPETGKPVFMPLMGHNHSPNTNNSVRVYHPEEDRWEYWQPDLHKQLSQEEWFAGGTTDPPSASGRNNYIGFYLPWEGSAGQLWIAAPGGSLASNHGIFDIAERRWVRLRQNENKPDFAPVDYTNEAALAFVNGWNYLDVTCDSLRTLIRYGGKKDGILVLVEPDPSGSHYEVTGYRNQPPGQRNDVRTSGLCREGQVYLFGGARKWKGDALREVWRLDVESREWHQMPFTPVPVPTHAVVTYDAQVDKAVILFSDGTNRIASYDLSDGTYEDLTNHVDLPTSSRAAGSFVPGVGHLYRGGEWGNGGWTSHRRVYCVSLTPEQHCDH